MHADHASGGVTVTVGRGVVMMSAHGTWVTAAGVGDRMTNVARGRHWEETRTFWRQGR
jgi:hypothetical protein